MEKIQDRDEFIEYIMKSLGHPIVTVNITEEQLEYKIDDALLKFYEFHNEGSYRYYVLHKMSREDVETGTLTLPDRTMAVIRLYPTDGLFSTAGNNLATTSYLQSMGSSAYGGIGGVGGSLGGSLFPNMSSGSSYTFSSAMISSSYMSALQSTVEGQHQFQYSRYGQKLWIDDKSIGVSVDDYILIEVYMEVDEDSQPIWNSIWLRKYATALAMEQWGINLIKFGNTQLANGTTINGDSILSLAREDIRTLEEELNTTWSEPLGVVMG